MNPTGLTSPDPCSATYRPWPLPGLTPELVSLCNRLSARELRLGFKLAQASQKLYLIPDLSRIAVGSTACAEGETTLRLRLESEVWSISLNELALTRVLGAAHNILPAEIRAEDLPPELRLAMFCLCLEPCLQQLSANIGLAVTLEDPEFTPATPAENTFILPFDLEDASKALMGKGAARIPLTPASLRMLLNLSRTLPGKTNSLDGLKIPFSLCAGQGMFSLQLLQTAETGDILLFDQTWQPDYCFAEICGQTSSTGWQGKLNSDAVTLIAPLFKQSKNSDTASRPKTTNKETSMANTEKQTPAPAPDSGKNSGQNIGQNSVLLSETDGKIDLNDLEVRLTLELEERLISLKELSSLAPGYTFVTTAAPENPVKLKINGKTVGLGQLVDVGGRLGVLVSTLHPTESATE